MNNSRRGFLVMAGLAPFAIGAAQMVRAQNAVCYDPAKLSLSDRNNRSAVNFLEVSKDPTKRCGLCVFYDTTLGNCGTCKLFGGMPTNAYAVCDSFSAKPG
jgi:hypothetical protein